MKLFDRSKIETEPLSKRENKLDIEELVVNIDKRKVSKDERIEKLAVEIINAKDKGKPVIVAFGAHLIKNGLGPVLGELVEKGYITHLATNGAGSIHDWEFAFQGKSGEDVRERISRGMFGMGEETGKFMNLVIRNGALNGRGNGESICKMIYDDEVIWPDGESELVKHPWKRYSLQYYAFQNKIPFTVHSSVGYDIIHMSKYADFASIGKTTGIDFLGFVESLSHLDGGGVYLSIGSAIMSPMVFEKSLSMERNVSLQGGRDIKDFSIVINDIIDGGWDFGSGKEPDENDPAYYNRLCKSFDRMGAREMSYIKMDNRDFVVGLRNELVSRESGI